MWIIILCQTFGYHEIYYQIMYLYFYELLVYKIENFFFRNIKSYDEAFVTIKERTRLNQYHTYNKKYFERP